jgi:hypothetical protein
LIGVIGAFVFDGIVGAFVFDGIVGAFVFDGIECAHVMRVVVRIKDPFHLARELIPHHKLPGHFLLFRFV